MSVFDPTFVAKALLLLFVLTILGFGLVFVWAAGQQNPEPYSSRSNRRAVKRRTYR
jgi:hypothetical protein